MSNSYYKNVDGKNYDREMLEIADESVAGIGDGRIFGCGIFLPHKSIDAVSGFKED